MKYKQIFEKIERFAARGEPLDDGEWTLVDDCLYWGLRSLYREFNAKVVTRNEASSEKTRLLSNYEYAKFNEQYNESGTQLHQRMQLVLSETYKSDCITCKKIRKTFDNLKNEV